jgi:hypothetical protein
VIKISGRQVRSPDIDTTLESLRNAKRAGVTTIMFVSDNFNKYPEVHDLLNAIADERMGIEFHCQCDTQIAKDPALVELLGRAGCCEMFIGVESFNRKTLKAAGKHHNHPRHYADIIKLCKDARIRPHFSNIIGFPDDDEMEIRHHLETLKSLRPTIASFFILTPIPGTEQYDEFLSAGLITELNLDRFDGSNSTWKHPILDARQLNDLLYHCYSHYSGFLLRSGGLSNEEERRAIYQRFAAAQRMHPMAGGVEPFRLDNASHYADLRRQFYDIDLAPLPSSLKLSKNDDTLNNRISWRKQPPKHKKSVAFSGER